MSAPSVPHRSDRIHTGGPLIIVMMVGGSGISFWLVLTLGNRLMAMLPRPDPLAHTAAVLACSAVSDQFVETVWGEMLPGTPPEGSEGRYLELVTWT